MTDETDSLVGGWMSGLIGLILFPFIAWGVELSWNALMPYLFDLPSLTYWKAFALAFLILLVR